LVRPNGFRIASVRCGFHGTTCFYYADQENYEHAQSQPRVNNPVAPLKSSRSDRNHHQVLASISRAAVLELLRSRAQPLGVAEVAQHVGLHQNTVRSHLDLLVDSGYAVRRSEAPRGPGRPRVVYEATAAPDGDRNYRLLAEVLAQHLIATSERPGEAAVNAGRSWAASTGRQQHDGDGSGTTDAPPVSEEAAIAAVLRLLGDSGFAPELSADGASINLHRCPDVVCGAHLGIIQGALADLGGIVSATRLLPFVTPGLCVTTLARQVAAPEVNAAEHAATDR
jgi:predicted ArsR family transcriptional regulator